MAQDFDTSGCTYHLCRHRTRQARLTCKEILRNLRLRQLDHIIGLAMDEKAQLLVDRFRNLDILFPAEDAGADNQVVDTAGKG